MKLENNTSGFAFTRNPIRITDTAAAPEGSPAGRKVCVSVGGKQVFGARCFGPMDMDVADMVEANIPLLPMPTVDGPLLETLLTAEELERHRVSVTVGEGALAESVSFIALQGGVSVQNFRLLSAAGTDVFSTRFLADGNFFLTTKSSGWRIAVKERELHALVFVRDGQRGVLSVKCAGLQNAVEIGNPGAGVYALNLATLRLELFNESNVLSSIFDVYEGEKFCCQIVVEHEPGSPESHLIMFENSLGVDEYLSLSGKLTSKMEPVDDDTEYETVDVSSGARKKQRAPRLFRQVFELATDPVESHRVAHVVDMIHSGQVSLALGESKVATVIPYCDDLQLEGRPTKPVQFTIWFESVWPTSRFTPDMISADDSRKPKLFTDQFNDTFK